MVAAVLIVVLVVLVLIPSGETEDRERRKLFDRKADQEEVDQAGESDDQEQLKTEEQTVVPETEEVETEAEEEQVQPVEESNKFFIIAGSFSKLKNASDLQDQLNSRGYNAEVMITENRMYRVSVASYASKEEAENALSQLKSEPDLQSCWLLSN